MEATIIEAMKQAKAALGIDYTNPYLTTVKNLHSRKDGSHKGVYILFCKNRIYYIGIAAKGSNTIDERFQPHYAKFTVNLPAMYGGTDRPKKETRWQFPKNWRKGIEEFFLENKIPAYHTGKQKKEFIQPVNLDWKPEFKPGVDIDSMSVLVWNLDHLTAQQIDALETLLIPFLNPVFNGAKK